MDYWAILPCSAELLLLNLKNMNIKRLVFLEMKR